VKLKLKRTPGIYLVGFMGSGKSTIGRMYADEIGWRFGDVDDDIEGSRKTTISDLFAEVGEEAFRHIETEAIQRRIVSIRRGLPTVLALGGGAFTREENVELLMENGVTVWIDTPFDIVSKRVALSNHRPLARDAERFAELFEERRAFYARAEYHIAIEGDDSRSGVRQLLALDLLG
jgi:shikimate kinase